MHMQTVHKQKCEIMQHKADISQLYYHQSAFMTSACAYLQLTDAPRHHRRHDGGGRGDGGVGSVRLWSVKPPVVRLEDGAEIKALLISER